MKHPVSQINCDSRDNILLDIFFFFLNSRKYFRIRLQRIFQGEKSHNSWIIKKKEFFFVFKTISYAIRDQVNLITMWIIQRGKLTATGKIMVQCGPPCSCNSNEMWFNPETVSLRFWNLVIALKRYLFSFYVSLHWTLMKYFGHLMFIVALLLFTPFQWGRNYTDLCLSICFNFILFICTPATFHFAPVRQKKGASEWQECDLSLRQD